MKRIPVLLPALTFWAVTPAGAQMPNGEYLAGTHGATTAVILAHGRDQGPDSLVVGPLRRSINKELGYHTLSLQMPVLNSANYLDYAATFPAAFKAIQAAIDYLASEKGVTRIYLMGYSMGARMTTAFLADKPAPRVVGYIGVGLLEGGGAGLDANRNLSSIRVPVIDIAADRTPLDLRSANNRQSLLSATFKQVRVSGADHSFRGYDDQVIQPVIGWLKEQEGKPSR